MSPRFIAALLGSLYLIGSGLVWLIVGKTSAMAVLAGGFLPICISVASLAIFFAWKARIEHTRGYQRFVLVNFLLKVILIGAWTAVALLVTSLPRGPFVISMLVNFFVWHLFEAYRYQSTLAGLTARLEKGVSA